MAHDSGILSSAIAFSTDTPWVELHRVEIPDRSRPLLPRELIARHRVAALTLELDDTTLIVAVTPPLTPAVAARIRASTPKAVEFVFAEAASIDALLWRLHGLAPRQPWA